MEIIEIRKAILRTCISCVRTALAVALCLMSLAQAQDSYSWTTISTAIPHPAALVFDPAGNLFVGTFDHTVMKLTPAGMLTTIAGRPDVSGSADGLGEAASFTLIAGITLDAAGNIFVADALSHTIRKVTQAGEVTTVAGLAGVSGTENGPGSEARFLYPQDVAFDANGNLLVADTYNNSIRKITPGGQVSTFAGLNGVGGTEDGAAADARFAEPRCMVFDAAGNLYVICRSAYTIRKITPSGDVSTVAGVSSVNGHSDGPAPQATFYAPNGIAIDPAGALFVADTVNHLVRKIFGGVVTTVGGQLDVSDPADGVGTLATFGGLIGMATAPDGNVYLADHDAGRIVKGVKMGPVVPAPNIIVQTPNLTTINPDGSFDFGSVVAGANTSVIFTIKNTGTAALNIGTISFQGTDASDFSALDLSVSLLDPDSSTALSVRFAPSTAGSKAAELHIASNVPGRDPYIIHLVGTASPPPPPNIIVQTPNLTTINPDGSFDFGSVVAGASSSVSFTIKNTGTAALNIGTISFQGTDALDFSALDLSVSLLDPDSSTALSVRFAPSTAGSKAAELHIASNVPGRDPYIIHLVGTASPPPPPPDLVGFWKSNGNADDSIGSNNGMVFGNLDYVEGHGGQAFHLFGGHVDVTGDASLAIVGPITVSAWIKLNATAPEQSIVERYGFDHGGYALRLLDGQVKFFLIDDNTQTDSCQGTTTLALDTWYLVTGVWDGAIIRVYVNGELDGSAPCVRAPGAGDLPLRIGARGDSATTPFTGLIDNVSVFARAHSPAEVLHLLGLDHSPVAVNDHFQVNEGQTLSIAKLALTANDSDQDGDTISVTATDSASALGVPLGFSGNTLLYAPPIGFAGSDSFKYTIADATGNSVEGTVSIDVTSSGFSTISGFNAADWQLNALVNTPGLPVIADGKLQLTDGNPGEGRSAFFKTPQHFSRFTATFDYRNFTPFDGVNPGDGFAFAIQRQGATAVGVGGSFLGFGRFPSLPGGEGISPAAGVAINVLNHWTAYINTTSQTLDSPADAVGTAPVDFTSTHSIHVTLVYDGTVLTESIFDNVNGDSFTTSYPVDIFGDLAGGAAYIGFTAGSGAAFADQQISNVHFYGSDAHGTPPAITQPPLAQTAGLGQSATFSVTATGDAPLFYQWRKDGNPIAGATGSTITVTPSIVDDGTQYDVLVMNASGSLLSTSAKLTVSNSVELNPATIQGTVRTDGILEAGSLRILPVSDDGLEADQFSPGPNYSITIASGHSWRIPTMTVALAPIGFGFHPSAPSVFAAPDAVITEDFNFTTMPLAVSVEAVGPNTAGAAIRSFEVYVNGSTTGGTFESLAQALVQTTHEVVGRTLLTTQVIGTGYAQIQLADGSSIQISLDAKTVAATTDGVEVRWNLDLDAIVATTGTISGHVSIEGTAQSEYDVSLRGPTYYSKRVHEGETFTFEHVLPGAYAIDLLVHSIGGIRSQLQNPPSILQPYLDTHGYSVLNVAAGETKQLVLEGSLGQASLRVNWNGFGVRYANGGWAPTMRVFPTSPTASRSESNADIEALPQSRSADVRMSLSPGLWAMASCEILFWDYTGDPNTDPNAGVGAITRSIFNFPMYPVFAVASGQETTAVPLELNVSEVNVIFSVAGPTAATALISGPGVGGVGVNGIVGFRASGSAVPSSHPSVRILAEAGDYNMTASATVDGVWVQFGVFPIHISPPVVTPPGSSVAVSSELQAGDPNHLELTFDTVTSGGVTAVNRVPIGPQPPEGYTAPAGSGGTAGPAPQGNYYDVKTTAAFDGKVRMCIKYDDSHMTPAEEGSLRLMHYSETTGQWTDITVGVDTAANEICGETASFSTFSLFTATAPTGNQPPLAGSDSIERLNNSRVAKVLKSALLANDTDFEHDTLSIASVGNAMPAGAAVSMVGNFVVYTVPSPTAGNGSFTYALSDGVNPDVTATVVVTETNSSSASAPNAQSIVISGGNVLIKFIGVPGHTYRLQHTGSLSMPGTWSEFDPPETGAAPPNGVFSFTIPAIGPAQYYRAVSNP